MDTVYSSYARVCTMVFQPCFSTKWSFSLVSPLLCCSFLCCPGVAIVALLGTGAGSVPNRRTLCPISSAHVVVVVVT